MSFQFTVSFLFFYIGNIIMHGGVFMLEREESFFHYLLFNASSKIILPLHHINENARHCKLWIFVTVGNPPLTLLPFHCRKVRTRHE
jgi:hypothetical protein